MLPAKNRLVTRRDFEEARKKGQKFQSRLFGLLVYPRQQNSPRFGFVVSTKLSKRATLRNRMKRLLREAVRGILPRVVADVDLVFLGKKNLLGKSLKEIQPEVKKILEKARLLK